MIANETLIRQYDNGAYVIYVNGHVAYTKYNTGDQVWFKYDGSNYEVVKIVSHDGRTYMGD